MEDLQTQRLVLHPVTIAEAERIVAGVPGPDDHWAPGYPFEGDTAAATGFLRVCGASGDPHPFGMYVVRRRADGQAIGGLGFHGPPNENGEASIGYGLIPSERGKGYASEALRRLLTFAREQGLRCVHGDTTHDNIASQHVMTAVGMRLTREDDELKYFRIDWPGR